MDKKKGEGITGVWQDWGFWLNLKLVLCFQSQCLTESLGFLNPQPRQAPERQDVKKLQFTTHQPFF